VADATDQAARTLKLYDKCKRAFEAALTRMNLETMERVLSEAHAAVAPPGSRRRL
jgi:hypothetical protein